MTNHIGGRIGPYHYSTDHPPQKRIACCKDFTLFISTALNAGIIGPEFNGIVILNDTDKQVVCDQMFQQQSGYFGPSKGQITQLQHLMTCDDAQFVAEVIAHKNCRPDSMPGLMIPREKRPTDWNGHYTGFAKECYHERAREALEKVAAALGLPKNRYEIRTNMGGPAVNGETTLHSTTRYIQVGGGRMGILARVCDGREDYCGKTNRYLPYELLGDPAAMAAAIIALQP